MTETATYPLPPEIAKYAGRILDVDGHEQIPVNFWVNEFGSIAQPFCDAVIGSRMTDDAKRHKEIDDTPIAPDTIFREKLEMAPGGIDLRRRLDVLDYVGMDRQMIYPGNMALLAVLLYFCADDDPTLFGQLEGDRKQYARKLIDAYNDWAGRIGRMDDRYRPVAVLIGESPEDLITSARRLLESGVRAFWLPGATPPGGVSPAHESLDPLWSLLADADAPALSHVGADVGFLRSMVWGDARAFEGWMSGEFRADPWNLSVLHSATENFVTTMILGGVFERHPTLRYGIAEVGAYWIGPMAQKLDFWHAHARAFQQVGGVPLPEKPSFYLRRNVRISGFDIEDIASYIDKFGLAEIYCFTADFPHREGGKNPIEKLTDNLSRHGDDVLRKFFVENGELLMPA